MILKSIIRKYIPGLNRNNIKKKKRVLIRYLTFFINNNLIKKSIKNDKILLIPPSTLDGSFGDELMTIAFINFYKHRKITVYYDAKGNNKIFSSYANLTFTSQNITVNYRDYYGGLYILGADNMTGTYGNYYPLLKCKIVEEANKYGVPTHILGFSIKNKLDISIEKYLRQISEYTLFKLREIDSFERAKTKFSPKNLTLVADLAFLCPSNENPSLDFLDWIAREKQKFIIGFCPNAIQARRIGLFSYISKYEEMLKGLENISIVFLYHDIRPQVNGLSDKDLSKILYEKVSPHKNSYFTDTIDNGITMKAYIQYVDFTVTGRMHFGISGYSLGKPMFGIAYEDKFSGLQKLFGLSPANTTIDFKDLDKMPTMLKSFIENYSLINKKVQDKLPNVLAMSRKNFL